MIMAQVVKIVKGGSSGALIGSGGRECQLPGMGATVSGIASATGGIRPGGLMETDRK